MKKIKFVEMLPIELTEIIETESIVYLPIGSMEWHGPHMAMGVDTENAYAVALGVAKKTGGAVMPPLYIGTEQMRNSEQLKRIGFKGNEKVIGMDFPNNTIKSMYWPEELFSAIIEQQICFLCDMGFRTVVIVNGHGADNQIEVLDKIAKKFTRTTASKVVAMFVLEADCGVGVGHAGLVETAIMQVIRPLGVDLSILPPKPQKLKNIDFAIVDGETFENGANDDFTVRYDPRDATPQLGANAMNCIIESCVATVNKEKTDKTV